MESARISVEIMLIPCLWYSNFVRTNFQFHQHEIFKLCPENIPDNKKTVLHILTKRCGERLFLKNL